MTAEAPCPPLNSKTATEAQGEALRKFRAPRTLRFLYRFLGQFSGPGVDYGHRPLLKPLDGKCFLGICLVTFWFTKGFLIGVHRKPVRLQVGIHLVTQ